MPIALGLHPNVAKGFVDTMNSRFMSWLPHEMQSTIVKNILHTGKQVLQLLDDSNSLLGRTLCSRVRNIIESRKGIGLLVLQSSERNGAQLGYSLNSNCDECVCLFVSFTHLN